MSARGNPLKVLYCESSADGTIGGSHYCLLYLLEHLDRTQFEPLTVFYEEHALMSRFRAVSDTVVYPQDAPVRWGRSGPLAVIRKAVNLVRFGATVAGNVAFIRRHGIRLVHLNNSITRHQNWMLAARLAGVPCIVHERGLSDTYTAADRSYARRVAAIIPMSAWIRDHMVARGVPGDNIRVMYDGLDPALVQVKTPADELRRTWNLQPDQRVIGIVGNIRPWKGQETVVKAFIEIAAQFPDVVCFFVGKTTPADEAYLANLERLLAGAGLGSRVRFTGYQQDVPSLMHLMDVVVHASVEPEPFGMVVLEGMAQHKPVVGSRAGGVIEMVVEGQTGFTFPPGDSHCLAAHLATLLGEPALARTMGEAGYERLIQSFTMQQYMRNIHETYRAVLKGRPIPADVGLAPGGGVSVQGAV